MKNSIWIILSVFMLLACQNENNREIEKELDMYFSSFEAEALLRGLQFDTEDLVKDAYVESIVKDGVVGQCNSYSDGSKTLVIDENYWERSSDDEKEYIIFHELGHCILERSHNDEKDSKGVCTSIMQSGLNNCRSQYTEENRDELLDELFDQ